jgi:hypothetical protein
MKQASLNDVILDLQHLTSWLIVPGTINCGECCLLSSLGTFLSLETTLRDVPWSQTYLVGVSAFCKLCSLTLPRRLYKSLRTTCSYCWGTLHIGNTILREKLCTILWWGELILRDKRASCHKSAILILRDSFCFNEVISALAIYAHSLKRGLSLFIMQNLGDSLTRWRHWHLMQVLRLRLR